LHDIVAPLCSIYCTIYRGELPMWLPSAGELESIRRTLVTIEH